MEMLYIIGIQKITNKKNGKIYIGQSNNIKRRFYEHCRNNEILIDKAIQKYGKEEFIFEVVEECKIEELNEKETYWIKKFKSNVNGYNLSTGGDQHSLGENNGRALLKDDDVIFIRKSYNEHKNRKEIYEYFKDKIGFGEFAAIWSGATWSHIMPEVLTKENKHYYSKEATNGEKSPKAKFSNKEVILVRQRYVKEDARSIYEDYKDRCKYQTFQQMLWGRTYSDLPIYKKQQKKWINL